MQEGGEGDETKRKGENVTTTTIVYFLYNLKRSDKG